MAALKAILFLIVAWVLYEIQQSKLQKGQDDNLKKVKDLCNDAVNKKDYNKFLFALGSPSKVDKSDKVYFGSWYDPFQLNVTVVAIFDNQNDVCTNVEVFKHE